MEALEIVKLELESVRINKALIVEHSKLPFRTSQIIVNNSRASIIFSQAVIKYFSTKIK